MSNKCLVTKLKATVNNSELPVFDSIALKAVHSTTENAEARQMRIFAPSAAELAAIEISVDAGYNFTEKATTNVGYNYGKNIIFDNPAEGEEYKILIKGKSHLNRFQIGVGGQAAYILFDLDIKQLAYSNLKYLQITSGSRIHGSLEDFIKGIENNPWEYFEFYYSSITGNVEVLQNLTTIKNLYYQSVPGVSGNIGVIYGKLINLQNTWFNGSLHITGTLESVAENQCTNGRTEGTLVMKCNGVVTLHGVAMTGNKKFVFSASGCVITNDSNVTIATYTKSTGTWVYA